MAQGYARATGKVGRRDRHVRPGRHQPGHADRRRLPRLDADRVHHRPGADAPDRHRRLPGGRHPGHHDADRQALLAGRPASRTSRGCSRRRSTSPAAAGPARCWSTSPRTSSWPSSSSAYPKQVDIPGYKPSKHGHPRQVITAAEAILAAERPTFYVGGGAVNSGVDPADLIRVAEAAQMPVVTTLQAKGAFPDSHPLCIGLPGMHGSKAANWAMNRCDLLIACGARFDDRVTGKLDVFAPGRQGHPHGRRPGRDRQEPGGRRSRSWGRSSTSSPSWRRRSSRAATAGRRRPPSGWRRCAAGSATTRSATATREPLKPEFVIERLRELTARPGRDLDDRRRPAPDVGRAVPRDRQAAAVADVGRRRHDGLRRAGGDRRQGRPAGRDRHQHRRRRLLPDDDAGAGDRAHVRHRGDPRGRQQRLAGHGAPVAGAVPRRALLGDRCSRSTCPTT